MTLPERMNLYRRAIARFGEAHQQSKVVEEIGELLAAMVHYRNGRISRAALCGEMADARIVMEQLGLMAGIPPGAVEREIERKLARLRARLDAGESRRIATDLHLVGTPAPPDYPGDIR